jgi:hypothetical protein
LLIVSDLASPSAGFETGRNRKDSNLSKSGLIRVDKYQKWDYVSSPYFFEEFTQWDNFSSDEGGRDTKARGFRAKAICSFPT